MTWIQHMLEHPDEVAELVTYVMVSLAIALRSFVVAARGLQGFARGLRLLALRTAMTWDDRVARAISGFADGVAAFAEKLDRYARRLGDLHAQIMPRTPGIERVEAEDRADRARWSR